MQRRIWILSLVVAALALGGLVGAALLDWPDAMLRPDAAALARVSLPGLAGSIESVEVRGAGGAAVPVVVKQGRIWPLHRIPSAEELTVAVTVRRPGWVGWLVGASAERSFEIRTPEAKLRGTWLQVASGAAVNLSFDAPVRLVSLRGRPGRSLGRLQRIVATGLFASGSHSAGSILVAAAARTWEELPPPVRVTWFPALAEPQVLATPRPGSTIAPDEQLTLVFSSPVAAVLGSARPRLSPSTPGHWQLLDAHTLSFRPSGSGFGLGVEVSAALPRPVILAGAGAGQLSRSLSWQVPVGSTLRLQQLLAQLGYLPLDWRPGAGTPPRTDRAELAAAITAPTGHFSWRYPDTPQELRALWIPGQPNTITRGAVMMFEHNNDLAVDGIAGPMVWKQLIDDVVAGQGHQGGYSYVYVHRNVPQSLNLWVDGSTILSSPGNTGVPAAPTQLGTYPVFEHIPVGTMRGRNPDGTRYDDPGIRWISYFHGGDAIHSFTRASYGTPQSLGCVELPLSAAAQVWPHTPIGTLVTIEN